MRSWDPRAHPASGRRLASLAERVAQRKATTIVAAPRERAAVAVILLESADALLVLLIRRAIRAGDPWSGHVGLPGGRSSPGDASLVETAVRETLEEVGVALVERGCLLGRLDDRRAIARGRALPLVISPFVFALPEPLPLRIDPTEVEEAFWVSVEALQAPENQTTWSPGEPGAPALLPAINVGRHVVWGLTLRMLHDLFAILDEAGTPAP